MASLVDFRPHPSHTPPIDTPPVDNNAPPFTDISPRAYSPPIKTTTNTNPQPTQTPASNPSTPGLEIPGAFPREQFTASAGTSVSTQKQTAPERSRTQSYPLPAVPKHLCKSSFLSSQYDDSTERPQRAQKPLCRRQRKKVPNRESTMTASGRYPAPSAKPRSQSCPTSAMNL